MTIARRNQKSCAPSERRGSHQSLERSGTDASDEVFEVGLRESLVKER